MNSVKALVENGSNINYVKRVTKLSPLHWAAFNNDVEVVEYLLKKGAIQYYSRDD